MQIKKIFHKIRPFNLSTPIAIILSAFIVSFHYVWINRIEIQKISLTDTSYLVLNKWSGKICIVDLTYKNEKTLKNRYPYCDSESYSLYIKTPQIYDDKNDFISKIFIKSIWTYK